LVNTEDASVSTVVDQHFAEDLPLNGRSFQTLLSLAPGVVSLAGGGADSGQFSVNGQRAASNYWMVDGVSANVSASTLLGGNAVAGAVGGSSVLGGTNSLVSVDAMQEFRIQTSNFAPEYGRTPGAQISIVTKSGGNKFHGTGFDYLRNDFLDANNWFNGYTNNPPLLKAEERQNDFGGTLSGPIIKNKTFFFFSYEGLRLRLPNTAITTVPDASARQNATGVMRPFLNAFPLDPKQPDLGAGIAQFNASFSNPARLDAYSLRIDHQFTDKIALFARYNNAPSSAAQRGPQGDMLSSVLEDRISTQQGTVGVTWTLSSRFLNELRLNYSRADASGTFLMDSFGGAVPLVSLPFPRPFTAQNGILNLSLFALTNSFLQVGPLVRNVQRQFNLVDTFSLSIGTHSLRFGVDYRRLEPRYAPLGYEQNVLFLDVPSFETGALVGSDTVQNMGDTLLFTNLSAFAQDTWRVIPRLTLTYGLRWDTDFSPSALSGPGLPALTSFGGGLSHLALAPAGTPAFSTTYRNLAPRFGLAYQLSKNQTWGTVARAGFGVFYDLATSEAGTVILQTGYPLRAESPFTFGGSFPLSGALAAPPPIVPPNATNGEFLAAFAPNLKLPYTLQYTFALEQSLGTQQSVTVSYVGAGGRRLIQTASIETPPPNIRIITNDATSDYDALQLQFMRRLSNNLQFIASYAWSHSIDDASAGSSGVSSNFLSGLNSAINRASSDFDIRHVLSTGLTYAIPSSVSQVLLRDITRGWSLQSVIQAQSARPVEIDDGNFYILSNGFETDVRPDITPGFPLYLHGPQYPGGKAINNTAGLVMCSGGSPSVGPFCAPPVNAANLPIRQGDVPRNFARGFGLFQVDLGVHRDFPIRESVTLQFRAELFNLFNHPNFAPPEGSIGAPQFGLSGACQRV
jgi:outer membrane receptor protein involved in Fe transport